MMRVTYDGGWEIVIQATNHANLVLANKVFYERIRAHASFDLTRSSPREIADAIERCITRLTVRTYKSRNPFSRAIGYHDERWPDIIFLNTRRLDRSVASVVGTIVHEAVHAADAASTLDFGHGGNPAGGKDNTAPYWIGNLAISMVRGEAFAVVEHAAEDEEERATAVA
jgi:hypothetical protein